MRAGEGWATEGHVFTDETGGALRPDHVSYAFDRAVEAASLPAITFHGLRHTAATVMLLAGVPPLIAAGRLGHDPAVLLSTYAHFVPGDDSDAAEVLGRAIYGSGS
jgi:integrase